MARRKNVKRIDPRYFLHETANRGDEKNDRGLAAQDEALGWSRRVEDDDDDKKVTTEIFADPGADFPAAPDFRVDDKGKKKRKDVLPEGCPSEEGDEAIDISQLSPEEAYAAGMAAARDAIDQALGAPDGPPPDGGHPPGHALDHPGQTCEEAHPGEPHSEG